MFLTCFYVVKYVLKITFMCNILFLIIIIFYIITFENIFFENIKFYEFRKRIIFYFLVVKHVLLFP